VRELVATRNRFRFEGILGSGGMATVLAAHDTHLDRPVAVKTLRPSADRSRAIGRFVREAQVMARLSSEHTVRVYELGYHPDGTPYIVMERIRGRALDVIVAARGPLPVAEAVEYTRQACLALTEAHAAGIVHRDVKPSNLLVEEHAAGGPRVKVVDFGVAKLRSEESSGLTSVSTLLGTPRYMAPEQVHSAHEVDTRADLWALGATLHFMLVGEPPFTAPDVAQLIDRLRHAPLPSLRARRPDVPAHVEAAFLRCLHRDPQGRFASARELARALTCGSYEDDAEPTAITACWT